MIALAIDLSPALRAALDVTPSPAPPPPLPPAADEPLRRHLVLRYASADEAESYRRVMRVLFLEHQSFGLRLRPPQIAERLAARYGTRVDSKLLEDRLAQLVAWGAIEQEHDASLAASAQEWRRNRFTFDVTPAGRLTEDLLGRLDGLGREHAVLDGQRIPAVRRALERLADELEAPEPDGVRLRTELERALGEVEALHAGALTFMSSLGALIRRSERVDEEEFERSKETIVEHLEVFRRDRRRWTHEVLAAIERIERAAPAARLVGLIVAAEEFVELPGGAPAAAQRARRAEQLAAQWAGVRTWFVGDDHAASSPWRTLDENVVEAIRALLDIAERLIARRTDRVDRASVLLHLAGLATSAPEGTAVEVARRAFGLLQPRHVGVPEGDLEDVASPGRTPWSAAPPAPVVAHMRRPGVPTPGRGRSARILDLAGGHARMMERRHAERVELEAVLRRFADRSPLTLSVLDELDAASFGHFLGWVSRAYETPAVDGRRRASSSDGRADIVLVAPADGARTLLRVPHGRLDTPDYRVEVRLR
ncbi:MAG TPA: TIGR02677 family protein [Solirubrobacteraceae bacterium]